MLWKNHNEKKQKNCSRHFDPRNEKKKNNNTHGDVYQTNDVKDDDDVSTRINDVIDDDDVSFQIDNI